MLRLPPGWPRPVPHHPVRQALRAHRTQVDPTGNWFKVPDDLVAEIYPWEDFRLAHSEVATDKPEDDLFAGLSVTRP